MMDRYGAEGTLVIALHGSPANRKAWMSLGAVLPPGIELLALDLPGHGSRRHETFTVDAALAVIAATIDREGRPAIVIGDSLGGYVTLAAGARLRGVAAVVAGGCTFEMRGLASVLARASDLPLQVALRIFGSERVERLAARVLPRLLDPAMARATAAAGLRLEARGESIRELAQTNTEALVRDCQVPIVFVNGSRDWPTRAGEGRFRELARRSDLVLARGMPHGVSILSPTTFVRAIERARVLQARANGGRPS